MTTLTEDRPIIGQTTIVNFRDVKAHWNPQTRQWDSPEYVYCGRWNSTYNLPKSKWHNPFKGEGAIERFRDYFLGGNKQHNLREYALEELTGKTLVCWCKPNACHCDVLVEWLNDFELETPAIDTTERTFTYDMFSEDSAQRDYYEHHTPTWFEALTLPNQIAEYRTRLTGLADDLAIAQREATGCIHNMLKAKNAFENTDLGKTSREYLELKHAMQHATTEADNARGKLAMIRWHIKETTVWLKASELRLEECQVKGVRR